MICSECKLPLPIDQGAQTCPRCFAVSRPELEKPSRPKTVRKPARKPVPVSKPDTKIDEPASE